MKIPENREDVISLMKKMEEKKGNNDEISFSFYDNRCNGGTKIGFDQDGWFLYSSGQNWCDQCKTRKGNDEMIDIILGSIEEMQKFANEGYKIVIEVDSQY